jgi:hypothetical protein
MVERVPLLGDVQSAQPRQTQGSCVRRRGRTLLYRLSTPH